MNTIVRSMPVMLAAFLAVQALTLPSQGYIVYTLPDGAIYRRMLNEPQGVKIVDQGSGPNINPEDGGIIVYIESTGSGRRAVLTDVDGLSRRAVGGTYAGMSGVYWTDRGDRFTFMYGNRQWGIMDTLGNFTEIPVPTEVVTCHGDGPAVSCSSDPNKTFRPINYTSDGGLGGPIIRGDLIFFNERAHVHLGHIDPDHPENGISKASLLGPHNGINGCFGNLSPNGDAYAHHGGGHGSVYIHDITKSGNDICAGTRFNLDIRSTPCDYCSYGIKWSNDYQWMLVRHEKDAMWYVVHLPPYGSSTLPDNPPYQAFQSFGDVSFFGMPDMWVGPFSRLNQVASPAISSSATAVVDSVDVTITSIDPQADAYYTLDGADPTQQSTRYTQPFGLRLTADSVVVKARAYKTGVDPSSVTTHVVRRFKLRDPVDVAVAPGLSYKYYTTGSLQNLPDFSTMTPVGAGTVNNFTLSPAAQSEYYAILFEGYVSVPASGIYRFATASDDGSRLWIGDELVVDNDGNHGIEQKEGTIGLNAGLHPITVGYFQGNGGAGLSVSYACTTLSQTLQPVTSDMCFHFDSSAVPTVRISSPAAGSVFHLGDTMHVRWTYLPEQSVRIMYSVNDGRNYPFEWEAVYCDANGAGGFDLVLSPNDTAMVSTQGRICIADYNDPNVRTATESFVIALPSVQTRNPSPHVPPAGVVFAGSNSIVWRGVPGETLPVVRVVSPSGRVLNVTAAHTGEMVRWDLGGLGAGVNIVRVRWAGGTVSRRIVVGR